MKEHSYTILVGSCDKYYDLLSDFKYLFNKHVNHNNNIYYLLEDQIFDRTIQTKGTWTSRVLQALDYVETDYILWAQDDYFFYDNLFINLDTVVNDMIWYSLDKYMMCEYSYLYSLNGVQFVQNSLYTTSTQFGMWKKEFLRYCLEICHINQPGGLDIWNFEILGSQLLNSSYTHKIYLNTKNVYSEAMKQGKRTDHYYNMRKEIDNA